MYRPRIMEHPVYFTTQSRFTVMLLERDSNFFVSFSGNIYKYCTGKMVYINVAVCLSVLLLVIGLSVGLSVNTFKGRDALDSAPLIDG